MFHKMKSIFPGVGTRLAALSGAIILLTGLLLTSATSLVYATSYPAICAQEGKGYCLNDWNGASATGSPVDMYNSGVSNDSFSIDVLAGYCNNGQVSNICPFKANTGLNAVLAGDTIFEIVNNNNGKCIGTNVYEEADMGPCPPANGSGVGSNIWVADTDEGCPYPSAYFQNVYWINYYDNSTIFSLLSGGSIGAQAYIYNDEYGSCWNAINQL